MGCVIGLVIIKVAFDIAKEAIDKMVDKACDDETIEKMKKEVHNVDGVKGLDLIKTRMFGTKIYVEIEISVDGNLILKDAHAKYSDDPDEWKNFEYVKHCVVHVNPYGYKHKKKQ